MRLSVAACELDPESSLIFLLAMCQAELSSFPTLDRITKHKKDKLISFTGTVLTICAKAIQRVFSFQRAKLYLFL